MGDVWLILISGSEERIVQAEGTRQVIPGINVARVEPFPDKQTAIDFMWQCRNAGIFASYPREARTNRDAEATPHNQAKGPRSVADQWALALLHAASGADGR